MAEYSTIGKSNKRIDTTSKATGEALFTADLFPTRMLVGKVLRRELQENDPLYVKRLADRKAKEAVKAPPAQK